MLFLHALVLSGSLLYWAQLFKSMDNAIYWINRYSYSYSYSLLKGQAEKLISLHPDVYLHYPAKIIMARIGPLHNCVT